MARTQFVVPQFLDVEPRIIGPITARQFLIMLGVTLLEFIIYRLLLSPLAMVAVGIPVLATGIIFAFAKVNGQPFHFIALNMVQTLRRPSRRVWDKTLSDADLRIYLKKEVPEAVVPRVQKPPLRASRLAELTLIVDTGGVYAGEN